MVQLKLLALFLKFIKDAKLKKPAEPKKVVFSLDGDYLTGKIQD